MRQNREIVNDRAKLIMHRIIAKRIKEDPCVIDHARRKLASEGQTLSAADEWRKLLDLTPDQISRLLVSRDQTMTRLRLSSPFIGVVDFKDPVMRRKIWKLAGKTNQKIPEPVYA